MRFRVFPVLVLLCLLLAACAGEPPAPTPAQFLNDAKLNLKERDLEAALKNLEKAIKAGPESPEAKQAMLLSVALRLAHAKSSREMAETYDTGRKQPLAAKMASQFGRRHADYNALARSHVVTALELVMKQRASLGNESVPLNIEFPEFRGTESVPMQRIRNGTWVTDNERIQCEQETCCNELARLLARLVGTGEDVHKAQEMFKKGGVQVDARVYLLETANAFVKLGEMFGPRDLDQPKYLRIVLEAAGDNVSAAMKLLGEKPDKALEAQAKKLKAEIEKELKKIKV